MNAAADALAAAAAAADGSTLATGAEDAAGALDADAADEFAASPALPPLDLSQAPIARGRTTHRARCTFMARKTSGFGDAE
jgi:hypothetical protein